MNPENQPTFDPSNPQYQKVADLPESFQQTFVDLPQELGGGFVEKEALDLYDAKKESAKEQYDRELHNPREKLNYHPTVGEQLGKIFNTKGYNKRIHERAIKELKYDADWVVPRDLILEKEKDLFTSEIFRAAWQKQSEILGDPSDRIKKTVDGKCGGVWYTGSIGGEKLDFHLCQDVQSNLTQFVLGEYNLSRDDGMKIVERIRDLAVDVKELRKVAYREFQQRLAGSELSEKLKNIPGESRNNFKERKRVESNMIERKKGEEAREDRSKQIAAEILSRIPDPRKDELAVNIAAENPNKPEASLVKEEDHAWEEKRQEIFELYRQISSLSKEDPEFARKVSKERQEFKLVLGGLPKEFGIPQDYMAFHHFAGGTINYESSPKLDLPGNYSVVKFYQRCINGDFPLQEGRTISE